MSAISQAEHPEETSSLPTMGRCPMAKHAQNQGRLPGIKPQKSTLPLEIPKNHKTKPPNPHSLSQGPSRAQPFGSTMGTRRFESCPHSLRVPGKEQTGIRTREAETSHPQLQWTSVVGYKVSHEESKVKGK